MWTPTSTNTPTSTSIPTRTNTPTRTLTPTNTNTPTRDPRYYYETHGIKQFAYIPPENWIRSIDDKSNFAFWETSSGCELAFFLDQNDISAAMYASSEQDKLSQELHYFELIEEGEFEPDSGLEAFWFSFIMGGGKYVAVYIFSDGNYALEADDIRPPTCFKEQDQIVEKSMRSMKFI